MDATAEAEYADYVAEHWRSLVRAAVFLGASPHEAEDLTQITLLKCYRSWDRVRAAENRDGYVYRMLLNALRDLRRSPWWRRRSDVEVPERDRGPEEAEAIAIADAVHRALASLSKAHRDVVVLRYFVQLSEAQTADALGIAAGTVKSRLARSLARLAADDHLQPLAGGQP